MAVQYCNGSSFLGNHLVQKKAKVRTIYSGISDLRGSFGLGYSTNKDVFRGKAVRICISLDSAEVGSTLGGVLLVNT